MVYQSLTSIDFILFYFFVNTVVLTHILPYVELGTYAAKLATMLTVALL